LLESLTGRRSRSLLRRCSEGREEDIGLLGDVLVEVKTKKEEERTSGEGRRWEERKGLDERRTWL